jgi:polygalacturonase
VQLMWSKDIIVANITLRNSPFWHFHPYDCTNVTVSNVTILSPVSGAPNTDGIDPGIHPVICLERLQYILHFCNI